MPYLLHDDDDGNPDQSPDYMASHRKSNSELGKK